MEWRNLQEDSDVDDRAVRGDTARWSGVTCRRTAMLMTERCVVTQHDGVA